MGWGHGKRLTVALAALHTCAAVSVVMSEVVIGLTKAFSATPFLSLLALFALFVLLALLTFLLSPLFHEGN